MTDPISMHARNTLTRRQFLRFGAVALAGLALPMAAGCDETGRDDRHYLFLSDIHFNPFEHPELFWELWAAEADAWREILDSRPGALPGYGQETNQALLDSALGAMHADLPNPVAVVFGGDCMCHGFDKTFASLYGDEDAAALTAFGAKCMTYVLSRLRGRFAAAPIYFTLGNHDTLHGDYRIEPYGPLLTATVEPLYDLCLSQVAEHANFLDTYLAHGSYSARLPGPTPGRLISLNTNHLVTFQDQPEDWAESQLNWLAGELDEAAGSGERVWLLGHVPPGIDVYDSIQSATPGAMTKAVSFWDAPWLERCRSLATRYRENISIWFAGHTHMDEYRLPAQDDAGTPAVVVSVCPSMTPLFGNNPGHKHLLVGREKMVVRDFMVFTRDISSGDAGAWQREYAFGVRYGLSELSPRSGLTLAGRLDDDATLAADYIRYLTASRTQASPVTQATWPAYRCSITEALVDPFLTCANGPAANAALVAALPETRPERWGQPVWTSVFG